MMFGVFRPFFIFVTMDSEQPLRASEEAGMNPKNF